MKKRVAELEGLELDAAVALAEGWVPPADPFIKEWIEDKQRHSSMDWRSLESRIWLTSRSLQASWDTTPFAFSSDWGCGGPIIHRERIAIIPIQGWSALMPNGYATQVAAYDADSYIDVRTESDGNGDEPLTAAMRAYVASKYGEEIDLPEFPEVSV